MHTRTLGDVTVSAIGLGGMPMSIEGRPQRERSLATIHAALDAGVTLIDTADAYHLHADEVGHNESLIAEGLRTWGGDTSGVLVATKGGHLRPGDGTWTVDGSPAHLRRAVEDSLRRLGVEAIGLYQFHRPDPRVPYADSVGVLAELLDAGKIRMAGISNANPERIRLAQEVLGGRLVSVQNQYSPAFRSSQPELDLCASLGIAFLPWSPLGGIGRAGSLGARYEAFRRVAAAHDVSPQQVALAWELSRSPVVIPIPGASRPSSIEDSVLAADLQLTPEELAALTAS
ncbi:aldo/keto reductase [Cellulomonas sp. McL0617]|uniref:aldo/keto reductase n=1 Tax=Cellulomonas sp. McL0617 TaxID=3415675 RepID=UPI003CEED9B9